MALATRTIINLRSIKCVTRQSWTRWTGRYETILDWHWHGWAECPSHRSIRESVRLDPSRAAAAQANLGWALLESRKSKESIPQFEAAVQLNSELKLLVASEKQNAIAFS